MPIRKYSASRKPRAYRRKRSSPFKKAVTSIAKRVVNRQAETKTGGVSLGVAFGTSGYLYDLWASLAQGVGQNQRVGDQIHCLGMKIRGAINMDPAVITANQDFNQVRMMIVAGKRPLVAGDFASVGWNGLVDPELMTTLVDKYIQFQTTKRNVAFQRYVKLNRTFKFDSAGAITNRPIYLYLVGQGGTGILAGTGNTANLVIQRYFKDI